MVSKEKKKGKIDFKHNWRVYLSFLSKYKLIFFLAILASLLSEVLNLTEKFLFKYAIDKGNNYGEKVITLDIFLSILTWIALIYVFSILIKAGVKWVSLHFLNKLEVNLITDLKQKFFNHIISLSHSFHISHKTGSLIARIGRGAGAVERMTDFLVFNVFPLSFQLIISSVSLFYFDFASAIIVLGTAGIFIVSNLYMQRIQNKYNEISNKKEDIEKARLADFMTNIEAIKYYGKESHIKRMYARLTNSTKSSLLKFWNLFRWQDSIRSLILWTGTLLLVAFSFKGYLDGRITIGTVVFIYTIYGSIFGAVFSFMSGIRGYYRSMVDFNELFEYGKIEQEVKDLPNAKEFKVKKGEIEFKDVVFRYNNKKLFDNFNLKIRAGEKIALVGHSGSGKTTLIKLLYRFYDVEKGKILIDGEDIRNVKQESLRSELSIVPQECVLFDDTIYNNISFSKQNATKEEVMRAIKFAQLDKTINSFPKKENTIVGERGVKLSGGEKQRVSIARALLANKKIIILDEATSSLDSKTEHEIQDALKNLLEGRTSIIIAHRLSTIMHADRIVVLDKGKIVEMGPHRELIRKNGPYRKLWELQKGGYIKD